MVVLSTIKVGVFLIFVTAIYYSSVEWFAIHIPQQTHAARTQRSVITVFKLSPAALSRCLNILTDTSCP